MLGNTGRKLLAAISQTGEFSDKVRDLVLKNDLAGARQLLVGKGLIGDKEGFTVDELDDFAEAAFGASTIQELISRLPGAER